MRDENVIALRSPTCLVTWPRPRPLRGSPCSVVGDPCAYALNNTYIHTYIHAHKHQLYSTGTRSRGPTTDTTCLSLPYQRPAASCILRLVHSPLLYPRPQQTQTDTPAVSTIITSLEHHLRPAEADSNRHPHGKYSRLTSDLQTHTDPYNAR